LVTLTTWAGLIVPTLWFPNVKLVGETSNAPGVGVDVGVAVAVAVEVAVAVAVVVAVDVAV